MSFSMKELVGDQPDQKQTQSPSPSPSPSQAPAPASQPAAPSSASQPNTVVTASPSSPRDPNSFSMAELTGDGSQPSQTTNNQNQNQSAVANHGILKRAWDWVNMPVFDNILPNDIKTSDIIKAATFEKFYHEAYIPGINDFDTKAKDHFEPPAQAKLGTKKEANGTTHPYVQTPASHATKNAIKTFIAGVGKDT